MKSGTLCGTIRAVFPETAALLPGVECERAGQLHENPWSSAPDLYPQVPRTRQCFEIFQGAGIHCSLSIIRGFPPQEAVFRLPMPMVGK
jgi:hypothetical protein